MNPEIERYLDEHGATYTPEALRKGLLDAGYDPAEVDAALRAWEAERVAPQPDAEGLRTFARWAVGLHLGALAATFLLLVALKGPATAGTVALGVGVLAIALLIGWAISSMIGRALLRGAGTTIALIVPAISAITLGGACFGLMNSAISAPPRDGTMEIELLAPKTFQGSGGAFCYVSAGVEVSSEELGTLDGRRVTAYLTWYPEGDPSTPAPVGGTQVSLTLSPTSETERPQSYSTSPDTLLVVEASANGLAGTVQFDDLAPELESPNDPAREPISGSITWTCE